MQAPLDKDPKRIVPKNPPAPVPDPAPAPAAAKALPVQVIAQAALKQPAKENIEENWFDVQVEVLQPKEDKQPNAVPKDPKAEKQDPKAKVQKKKKPENSQKPLDKKEQKLLEELRQNYEENQRKRVQEQKRREAVAIIRGEKLPEVVALPAQNQLPLQEPVEAPQMERIDAVGGNHPALAPAKKLPVVAVHRRFEEDYVNNALTTLDGIAVNIANCLYNELIVPKIDSLKDNSAALSSYIGQLASFVLNLGNLSGKEFAKLCEAQIIPAAVSEKVPSSIKMLTWLIDNEFIEKEDPEAYKKDLEVYQNSLLDETRKQLEPNFVGSNDFKKPYLTQSLLWIFDPERKKTFADYIQEIDTPNTPEKFQQAKDVCLLVMKTLVETKVKLYCKYLHVKLRNEMADLLQKQFRDDIVRPMARFETEHLMDTIRHLKWTNLIDGVISTVYDHTNAYLDGMKGIKAWEADEQKNTKNTETRALLTRWEAYRQNPESFNERDRGELEVNREMLEHKRQELEISRDTAFWKGFVNHRGSFNRDTAHEVVVKILNDKVNRRYEVDAVRGAQEKTAVFFANKANQIIEILICGDMHTLDFWCKYLSLNDEFKKLFLHAVKLTEDGLVSEANLKLITSALKSEATLTIVNSLIKAGVETAKEKLKTILESKLMAKLEQYSDPDELKELFADMLLPQVLIPKIVQIVAQGQIFKKEKIYAALFLEIVDQVKTPQEIEKLARERVEAQPQPQPKPEDGNIEAIDPGEQQRQKERLFQEKLQVEIEKIIQEQSQNEKEKITQLMAQLYRDTNLSLPNAPLHELEMTKEKFAVELGPFIKMITDRLKDIKNKNCFEKLTVENVLFLFRESNKEQKKVLDSRPHYGQLVHNLLIEMTSLKNAKANQWALEKSSKIKNAVLSSASDFLIKMLDDTRKSPAQTIDLLMGTFKDMYAAGEPTRALLFGEPGLSRPAIREALKVLESEKKEIERYNYEGVRGEELEAKVQQISNHRLNVTDRKFNKNFRNFTNLTYDFTLEAIGDYASSSVGGWDFGLLGGSIKKISKGAALGQPEDFYNMVMEIYKNLLGDHTRNKSLIYQIVDDFVTALFLKSQEIRVAEKARANADKANAPQEKTPLQLERDRANAERVRADAEKARADGLQEELRKIKSSHKRNPSG